jgi:hypothetical protein
VSVRLAEMAASAFVIFTLTMVALDRWSMWDLMP